MSSGRKEKISNVGYVVQSDINRSEVYVFTERPMLCKIMSAVTGGAGWSKETLDYHFTRLRKTEFQYRGYTIYMRPVYKGKSRGRFSVGTANSTSVDDSSAINTFGRDNY